MKNQNDIDSIIENFKKIRPSETQFDRWQSALLRARRKPTYYLTAGLAAGLIFGILSAHAFLSKAQIPDEVFSATFAQHSVKNL